MKNVSTATLTRNFVTCYCKIFIWKQISRTKLVVNSARLLSVTICMSICIHLSVFPCICIYPSVCLCMYQLICWFVCIYLSI